MRSLLGRFHRPMSRGAMGDMLTMNSLGDGSTLSLDFTTMGGVLDPRLTFSRASTATFVNSSGYVEYAAQNLFYNTNFATIDTTTTTPSLTGTGWGYALNSGVGARSANFNTNGSVTMSASNARIGIFRSAGFAGTGRRLIFSVDITSVGDTGLPPSQLVNEGTKTNDSYYIDGTLWVSGNVVGPCTVSFVFTSNPSANAATYFGIGMSSNSTGAVTFANPRWGLYGSVNQLTYYPNTSATNANYLTAEYHAPRFDYSPTNIGEPRGLLVEGQTANITLYSEKLNQSVVGLPWYYANLNTPTVATGIADPYGNTTGTTAWKLVATGTGYHAARQTWTFTAATYTFSFYAKAAEYDRVTIGDLTNGQGGCSFVLTGNGTATVRGGGTNPQITPYGTTGWYRCSVTINMTATAVGMSIVGYPAATTPDAYGASYTADGTSGVYVTMVQVELGTGASSYIPTGASGVTRNGDSCVMTGTNFSSWFAGATEGVLFAQYEKPRSQSGNAAHDYSAVASKYNTGEGFVIYAGNSNFYPTNILWPTGGAIFAGGIATAIPSVTKQAGKWFGGNDVTMYSNGVVGTTAAGTGTVTPAMLSFGANSNTGTEATRDWLNACIRKVKFYPTALSDAAIQTLTTP